MTNIQDAAPGDINADTLTDIVYNNGSDISVLYGLGDGTFAPTSDTTYNTSFVANGIPITATSLVAATDLNNDGFADILAVVRTRPTNTASSPAPSSPPETSPPSSFSPPCRPARTTSPPRTRATSTSSAPPLRQRHRQLAPHHPDPGRLLRSTPAERLHQRADLSRQPLLLHLHYPGQAGRPHPDRDDVGL